MLIRKFFCAAFTLFLFSLPEASFSTSQESEEKAPKNWEISVGVAFSGSQGNTDKTDIGADVDYRFDDVKNKLESKSEYRFSKTDGKTNQDFWNSKLNYFRQINNNDSQLPIFLDLGSFVERDEIGRISLKYGFGGGLSTTFPVFTSLEALPSFDVVWEREDGIGTPIEDFVTLHFGVGIRTKIGMDPKLDLSSFFILPANETGNYRSESRFSLEFPVYKIVSLKLSLDLDFDNQPVSEEVKKTDLRYKTSLNVSF